MVLHLRGEEDVNACAGAGAVVVARCSILVVLAQSVSTLMVLLAAINYDVSRARVMRDHPARVGSLKSEDAQNLHWQGLLV